MVSMCENKICTYIMCHKIYFLKLFLKTVSQNQEYLMRNLDIFHNQEINKNILFS